MNIYPSRLGSGMPIYSDTLLNRKDLLVMFYKDRQNVKNVEGWAKMYYVLLGYTNSIQEGTLLNYLIDVEPIAENYCPEEGYRDYWQCASDFIQRGLQVKIDPKTINKWLKHLEQCGFISIHYLNNNEKSLRFIKLNYEKLDSILGVSNEVGNSVGNSVGNEVGNHVGKNYLQNRVKTDENRVNTESIQSKDDFSQSLEKELSGDVFNSTLGIYSSGAEPTPTPTAVTQQERDKPVMLTSRNKMDVLWIINNMIEGASDRVKKALSDYYCAVYDKKHMAVTCQSVLTHYNKELKGVPEDSILNGCEYALTQTWVHPYPRNKFKKTTNATQSVANQNVHSTNPDEYSELDYERDFL